MSPKRLAVIPARGGSKRIPNKNIREFSGKPIISYIINAAKESGLFSKIHVSTESDEIANVAAMCNYYPEFMRPIYLADDHTPIMPVLQYVAAEYAKRGFIFDQIWLLMACSPLVGAHDLIEAEDMFRRHGSQAPLQAVSEYPVPIDWAFNLDPDGLLRPVSPGMFAARSQDLPKRYFDAGAFTAYPSSWVIDSIGAGTNENFYGYVLPKWTAVDIDDEADWQFLEKVYSANCLNKNI